jgi:hypothetical protein
VTDIARLSDHFKAVLLMIALSAVITGAAWALTSTLGLWVMTASAPGLFSRSSPSRPGTSSRWGTADALPAPPGEPCHADRDGDCFWALCPQIRDGEPESTGRSCPLWGEEPEP